MCRYVIRLMKDLWTGGSSIYAPSFCTTTHLQCDLMATDLAAAAAPDTAEDDGGQSSHSSATRRSSDGRYDDLNLKTFPLRQLEPFIGRFIAKLEKNVSELRQCRENLEKVM